jgi:hypothetical protein
MVNDDCLWHARALHTTTFRSNCSSDLIRTSSSSCSDPVSIGFDRGWPRQPRSDWAGIRSDSALKQLSVTAQCTFITWPFADTESICGKPLLILLEFCRSDVNRPDPGQVMRKYWMQMQMQMDGLFPSAAILALLGWLVLLFSAWCVSISPRHPSVLQIKGRLPLPMAVVDQTPYRMLSVLLSCDRGFPRKP